MPVSFRDELGRNIKIRLVMEPMPHLQCFNEFMLDAQFKHYMENYGNQLGYDMATLAFGSYTYNGQIDNQGRITIPAELKEQAGIEENVCILGSIDVVRIMSPECKDELLAQMNDQQRRVVYAINKANTMKLMGIADGTVQL